MQLTTINRQGFAPATITEAIQFSEMLAASAMVPKQYQGKPQDIMVCVQWGYEIGLAPMQALQNIAVINGKPSVYGDAAMALVQASPVCEDIEEYFEGEGTPNPVAVCVAKRKGRKPVVAKFSVEDAKRAGLWGKQGPWQAYPKRMMQMRARGFALRDAFPDVLKGLITAEEAQDYPQDELSLNSAVNSRQSKPANPLDLVAPPVRELNKPDIPEPEILEPTISAEPEDVVVVEEAQQSEVVVEPDDLAEANAMAQEIAQDLEEFEPTVVAIGYQLVAPGKDEPLGIYQTLDEWQDAYEAMADKISKAGKVEPRQRMTKLREFKEANEQVLNRIDTMKRVRTISGHQRRLKALGATL